MTERLYDTDAYRSTFSATVLECTATKRGYDVVLDQTAFFPEGGGQYGDGGWIGQARVVDTQIRNGVIYHSTQAPVPSGAMIECRIDWDERFRRMQNHSGEHVISGIVHRLFGYENVGFHLSHREMTMDYSGELTWDDVKNLEALANRAVWENREIVCRYPTEEELSRMEYRSKKELTEAVRIVAVDGIDVCACCAPHVNRTGEIGGVFIVDAIRWKGGTRLTVRCGCDAYEEYRGLREDERSLSALFSAPRGQIFPAAEKLQKEYTDLRRQYDRLRKENALIQLESLPFQEGNLCFVLSESDGDSQRAVALEGLKKCTGVFVCLAGNDAQGYRYVIASSRAGLALRANQINGALQGRGGGKDPMIQGSFSASKQAIFDYFKEFQI
ncbi:MAG: alanyl-tRNA editing protein [Clostridia bacterium]|nr:alanyl-tRNA editing protein [Clostridia bacterium]